MARAGACSRRDAEAWIEAGRVAVNGETLTSAARNVREGDQITIDGQPLSQRERTRLFLFHKPAGLVTSAKDPEGRATVFAHLSERFPDLPRVVSVGRLDINTEGLLLLSNDGGLARVLELPATGWTRRYRVRAHGDVDQAMLDALANGVTIDGMTYAPIHARLERVQGSNAWIAMSLTEGKNREIKRVLEHLRLDVTRLIRVSFGPFQLGDLEEGAVEEVRLRVLRDQIGKGLAELAGVDFSSPLREPPTPEEAQEKRKAQESRPRKHVSALRKEHGERGEAAPRKRIERAMTADRKGRAVAVERVVVKKERGFPETRNARRFKEMRGAEEQPNEARPPRRPRVEERSPRREGFRREEEGARAFQRPRAPRTGDDARRFERPRQPEGERPQRGPSRFREDRPPRRDGFRSREERPRAPRTGDDARRFERPRQPEGERPQRGPSKFRDDRPPRKDSAGGARKGPHNGPRKGPPRSGPPKGGPRRSR